MYYRYALHIDIDHVFSIAIDLEVDLNVLAVMNSSILSTYSSPGPFVLCSSTRVVL